MNGDRGSIEPGTLLLIACVLGIFIFALVFAVRSNTKRAAMIQDFAVSKGWSFSRVDTQGLSSRIDPFFPDETFRLDNIVTIETAEGSLQFFDCGYHNRERRRGGNFGMGSLIVSGRFQSVHSQIEIVERSGIDSALLLQQVDMGESEFARQFIVTSKDPAAARKVLTDALQQVLVNHRQSPLFNPVRVVLASNGAVVLTGLNAEPERWQDLVDVARRIESSLP